MPQRWPVDDFPAPARPIPLTGARPTHSLSEKLHNRDDNVLTKNSLCLFVQSPVRLAGTSVRGSAAPRIDNEAGARSVLSSDRTIPFYRM